MYDDVLARLTDEGFKDIKKIEIDHETAEMGTIMRQNYPANEEVIPDETSLEFTVSKGPALIEVMDLSGYTVNGARTHAESEGLRVDVQQEQYHETIEKGTVISQTPAAGTSVKKGSRISVVISKGPEDIPPETVTKEIKISYEPLVEEEPQEEEPQEDEPLVEGEPQEDEPLVGGEPQEVQIFIEDMDRDITVPDQTIYITEDREILIKLTILPGQVAHYKITRDGSVYDEGSVPFPQ